MIVWFLLSVVAFAGEINPVVMANSNRPLFVKPAGNLTLSFEPRTDISALGEAIVADLSILPKVDVAAFNVPLRKSIVGRAIQLESVKCSRLQYS